MGEFVPEEATTIWFYDDILMERLLKSWVLNWECFVIWSSITIYSSINFSSLFFQMKIVLTHEFNKYSLSAYYVINTILLGTGK